MKKLLILLTITAIRASYQLGDYQENWGLCSACEKNTKNYIIQYK